jgi:hypothetical protein
LDSKTDLRSLEAFLRLLLVAPYKGADEDDSHLDEEEREFLSPEESAIFAKYGLGLRLRSETDDDGTKLLSAKQASQSTGNAVAYSVQLEIISRGRKKKLEQIKYTHQ